jgi:hypothetical protein
MSDYERDYPSTEKLAGLRKAAAFYFSGGVILALLQFLARPWIIAAIAGIIICAVGIGWLMANNPINKRTGALIIAIGIIVALSKTPIKPLTVVMGIVLSITTMGFLVLGIKNLVLYFIVQNKRY